MSIINSLRRIKAITVKEIRQLKRDKITFGMVVMIPLIQLLLFGYAINTDVRNIPVAIVDQSDSAAGRWIVEAIKVTQVVSVEAYYKTSTEAIAAITRGEIRAALILPPNLTEKLANDETLGQWIVDGSDTMIAGAMMQLRNMPLDQITGIDTQRPSRFEVALFYNPEQRSAVNIVPGLIAVILTMTMIMFTSAAIVREREKGNLELLITTPIKPLELMLGKILPYIIVGLIQMTIILGLGHYIFDVPINGDITQLLLGTLLFIAASLTLGLIISTIARTQLQAMQMTIFIILPTILLSGFMFPFEAMPKPAQWIAEILPATHFMRIIRAVVLRGGEVSDMPFDALWLIGFTIIGIIIASMRFNKRLD
ncbi:ABC transporter permease [Shewanella sp. D64]|uniref:ABC transporter permease n=1 Tax=unclassified Shewanella TaxID=196818 RepID=UPI0022BA64AE|nr:MULTISPECIES: ABC transporter permease [unclassified Shewanella]MEC4725496.1 ABC transporter permease [Shewanella sp. D64]MEC4738685.1 ABC transporter permease [Shewanella sp. E94]WBJ94981.1 ABC transporter permease [Shewanella sp. MTB7]